jgi:hypothetical protein
VIAIKPTSAGAWPDDVPRSEQKWWYRIIDDEQDLGMALRFSLSQKNVVSAIPASFIGHFENVVSTEHMHEPITRSELEKLFAFAQTSNSHFIDEQKRGLMGNVHHFPCDDSAMC